MINKINLGKGIKKYYLFGFLFLIIFGFTLIQEAKAKVISVGATTDNIGIGTTAPGTYTLNVNGNSNISGTLNVTGGITGGSLGSTLLSASNVSAGAFGSNSGGGNYSFPNRVWIGTTGSGYSLDVRTDPASITSPMVQIYPNTGTDASILLLNNGGGGAFYLGRQNSAGNSDLASGLAAYASVIGNTAALPLHFITSATSRMMIDSSGNVGIGTNNPGAKLEVNGSVIAGGGSSSNWASGNFGGSQSINASGSIYSYNSVCVSNSSGQCNSSGGVVLGLGNTSASTNFPTSGNSFINNGGNVGIGTASPGAKLDILAGTQGALVYSMYLHNGYYQDGSAVGIGFGTDGTSSYTKGGIAYDATGYGGWNRGDIKFLQRNSADSVVAGLSDAVMTIKNTGNVGIGTTNPGAKLAIANNLIVGAQGGTDTTYITGGSGYGASVRLNYADGVANTILAGNTNSYLNLNYGNVGIGTTGPGYKLDVQGGQINASGGLCIAGSCKTNWNQVTGGSLIINDMGTGDFNASFTNTAADQVSFTQQNANGGNNSPVNGTWYFTQNIRHTNASNYWGTQLAYGWEDHANRMWIRNVSSGGFNGWSEFITSSNIGSQTVSNSDMTDGLHVSSGRNNVANQIVRTDGNGYMQTGYINSSNGDEGNNSNPSKVWGTNGSDSYLRTYLTSALSVNYANSAGNSDTVDGQHFAWDNRSNNPTYVWAIDSNGSSYLAYRPAMSVSYANSAGSASNASTADKVNGFDSSPDNSHPGSGLRPFYSWNKGQPGNSSSGYSNGITIGSNPGDTGYGFQIVQSMWNDNLYFRRYNYGWQNWYSVVYKDSSENSSIAGTMSAGAFQYGSDISLKKNIATIDNPLAKILQLRGVTFNWKKDNSPSVGLIAQEVEKVFPELVGEADGHKTVEYGNLVAPLIEAVKAQQKEIEDLNTRIKVLETQK